MSESLKMPTNLFGEKYLSNTAMKATAHSLGLISSVIGFEIAELWTSLADEELRCVYVHATDTMLTKHPHIVAGHHPQRDVREHVISPQICKLVSKSSYRGSFHGSNCHWKSVKDCEGANELYPGHPIKVKTEMAYRLEGDTGDLSVFVVGLSPRVIERKDTTIKFMGGLAYAVYIAAFNSEEEIEQLEGEAEDEILDDKKFVPEHEAPHNDHGDPMRRASFAMEEDPNHAAINPVVDEQQLGIWSTAVAMAVDDVSEERKHHPIPDAGQKVVPDDSNSSNSNTTAVNSIMDITSAPSSGAAAAKAEAEKKVSQHDHDHDEEEAEDQFDTGNNIYFDPNRLNKKNARMPRHSAPTWDPASPFSYAVGDIPVKYHVPDNLTFENFSHVQHLADGSNSNVFLCRFNGSRVVVKLIKEDVQHNPIAVHEFDQEYGMLARIDHPNIIRVLGAGQIPRRFIVLEHLGGGSLHDILAANQQQQSISNMLFRKPSFTYDNLLVKARDMAAAFDYLHVRCHAGATIIHRDLKPDNVGFTSDGKLKLFDFGLVTCVKTRNNAKDCYEMTGYTGSLRYMAPEVALREPYTEKVDVYSFGIMLWQMAKDRVPFKGMNKQEFFRDIVEGGTRPKLDKTWPAGFNDLLARCWRRNSEERPSFAMIVIDLERLIEGVNSKANAPRRGKPILKKANTIAGKSLGGGGDTQSSWF